MGLSITGYVLEPPRVGSANSAFTYTPNNYISDQGAFDAAYPSDESVPRTEYQVFVLNDFVPPGTGPGVTRSFVDATFAWTKNEVVQRFDYEGRDGRFKTLPGAVLVAAGVLASDSNTSRIKVTAPVSSNTTLYPVRVSVGIGSGTTFPVAVVLNDGAFTVPAVGTVQLSQDTGNLNWNPADLVTFAGQSVRFQRQTFYTFDESSGNIGLIQDVLLLNPLPASGQFPFLRIGFGEYLTPVEKANEGSFSANPAAGTVEWAITTGRLKFNTGDVAANTGRNVYYDGSAFAFGLKIKTTDLGTVNAPGVLSPLPPEASDLFFRVVNVVQFAQTKFVDTLTSPGKKGVVQIRRSDGQIQFSVADQTLYGADAVQAVVPDLDIERGMTLRMFRSPVNLDDSDATLKDVAAFYTSTDALWADPIIGSPTVALPAVPVDTRTITVKVKQGTGTFVTDDLPRLDVPTPPVGLGYIIDFEKRELVFAQRKANDILPAPTPYGGVQLPDPLVFSSGLVLEVETSPNSGVFTPLVIGEDALVDLESGMVTIVSTEGDFVTDGIGASFAGSTLTDSAQNFTGAGVLAGDYLIILTGASKGVFLVSAVGTNTLTTDVPGTTGTNLSYEIRRGAEILADRFFYEVPPVDPNTKLERTRSLGTITNSPRLSIDPVQAVASRFRFGKTVFSTSTVVVVNDGAFTPPSSLPQGTVEVAQDTGHLNFSQADVTAGGLVYWARTLTLGVDYTLQPPLGFVQFAERMLEKEEAFITYKNSDDVLVQERATFLVRKELTQPHPSPTSTLFFNPLGRELASNPVPRVFRGGRPQATSDVTFDYGASSVTFIGASTVTDALPSGPVINPNENVYVDYNVYEAIGGEQSFTVLQPPMKGVIIVINEGDTSLQVPGDRTTVFAANIALLVDRAEAYLIGSSSYDAGTQITTVTLAGTQTFRSDLQNPALSVSSGAIRVTGTLLQPSYFVTELDAYDPVPRGSKTFRLTGDHSRTYVSGTVTLFTDGTYTDFNVVSGSKFDPDTNKTEVTLLSNGFREYSGTPLKRSVRPVLPSPSASVTTSRSPELGQPYVVFRRIEGHPGVALVQPDDYKIDAAGTVTFANPLTLNEELGIFYTGDTIIEAGRRFRASYTFGIVPSDANGLAHQTLKADYTTYVPDTFFWRVETFTNFRGELVEDYEESAKSSVPTGGPVLENSSQPKLFEQGKESVFFQEGHLANEDLVARPTLKYFNDSINLLEDALQSMDGRYVGDHDGRFLFDGLIDNPPRNNFADVTNQIDDKFKISPAPYSVTGPPFMAVSIGTYREVYKASPMSRFYPTRRKGFGVTTAGTNTGDPIMDLGADNLRAVSGIQRRFPWCMTTAPAVAGSTALQVDDADGATDLLRPPFEFGMNVAIIAQDGTVLAPDGFAGIVLTASGTTLVLSLGVPVDIPIGSTVRLSTTDTTYNKLYRLGVDVDVDLERGLLLYIEPSGSLLAWAGLTQTPTPPSAGESLDVVLQANNTLTEPFRFPALDGGTTDDDGNRGFPILNPWAQSEAAASGFLTDELRIINSSTGTLRAATTAPYVSTGSLDGTGTVITNLAGVWPSPAPKLYDLVEIRTGPNGPSTFRSIIGFTANTITVATAFSFPSVSGFTFSVTVGTPLINSVATSGSTSSVINDTFVDYLAAGVLPGHTVIMDSGASTGSRRQVLSVNSATQIVVTPAFPTTALGENYHIDNALETFGGATNDLVTTELIPDLAGETGLLSSIVATIDDFFNTAFTDVATGSDGVTLSSSFTSTSATFITDGVNTSHMVFVRSGVEAGFYGVASVNSQTQLDIAGNFPSNTSGISYRIISSIGLTKDPLNGVLSSALSAETFSTDTQAFLALLTTTVAVDGDASAYAIRLLTSDLDTREAGVSTRITQIPNDVTAIESELSAGDRLYDKRYVWIDARINLEDGILPKKDRAVQNRIKAQKNVLKQLTKLLSVQKK
jgi:hypothetical protein